MQSETKRDVRFHGYRYTAKCVWRDRYLGVHGNHLELQKHLIVRQQ